MNSILLFFLNITVLCTATYEGECIKKEIWITETYTRTLITEDSVYVFPNTDNLPYNED